MGRGRRWASWPDEALDFAFTGEGPVLRALRAPAGSLVAPGCIIAIIAMAWSDPRVAALTLFVTNGFVLGMVQVFSGAAGPNGTNPGWPAWADVDGAGGMAMALCCCHCMNCAAAGLPPSTAAGLTCALAPRRGPGPEAALASTTGAGGKAIEDCVAGIGHTVVSCTSWFRQRQVCQELGKS